MEIVCVVNTKYLHVAVCYALLDGVGYQKPGIVLLILYYETSKGTELTEYTDFPDLHYR